MLPCRAAVLLCPEAIRGFDTVWHSSENSANMLHFRLTRLAIGEN
jgi:hypothetical protein